MKLNLSFTMFFIWQLVFRLWYGRKKSSLTTPGGSPADLLWLPIFHLWRLDMKIFFFYCWFCVLPEQWIRVLGGYRGVCMGSRSRRGSFVGSGGNSEREETERAREAAARGAAQENGTCTHIIIFIFNTSSTRSAISSQTVMTPVDVYIELMYSYCISFFCGVWWAQAGRNQRGFVEWIKL